MFFLLTTLGCSLPQRTPSPPDTAAACGRVYGSTRTTLEQMYASSTEAAPPFLTKKAWTEACVAAALTPEQLDCADPRIEMADPGCVEVLDPVRDRVQALREQLVQRSSP